MLNKTTLDISFAQGIETKVDPKRVSPGKFLSLSNSVFNKQGLLTKRNGFGPLSTLPTGEATYLTTFNGNLTGISNTLNAYSAANQNWVNKGNLQPCELSTLSLIRSNLNQSQSDTAIAANGLICTVYTDNTPSGPTYKYAVADSITGQNLNPPTLIPAASGGTVSGSPRVFVLGQYFIIVFTNIISATDHLQYIAVSSSNPSIATNPIDIASSYQATTPLSWDGIVAGSNLYVAYSTLSGGQSVKVTYITSGLGFPITPVVFAGSKATAMSMTVDLSTPSLPIIYASFFDSTSSTIHSLAVDQSLNVVLAPTLILSSGGIANVASAAQNGVLSVFYEVTNPYGYDGSIPSNYIASKTCTQGGTVGPQVTVERSVGLASKAFIVNSTIYMLSIYFSLYQPTYFLIDSVGNIVAKLAYSNGGTYVTAGLPSVTVNDNVAHVSYLLKDLVEATNKTQGRAVSAPVYSQTGISLANIEIGISNLSTGEIGRNLHLSGGFTWAYDGYSPVEQMFHVWPDNVEVTTATGSGAITAQQYFYQATYEWSDNQGNLFRSAPSIPVTITTTTGSSTNTIYVPTLRLTAKVANPVKIVLYRWSVANQIYYQVTSIQVPILNDKTMDYVTITDTLADSSIIGNNIIYTTGGVIENIGPPATNIISLFNDRLFLVDAEEPNLLWFSKQVLEATPVEMSDLLTIYVAPSIGAQGSTGPITALSAMDDKLIVFKKNAINYINGTGPDNTGANNQYSDPIFITSTVGSDNQQSIVFMPNGLMFQSDKGIWLLDRNLSTSYIGAPVENFTLNAKVLAALAIPETNQVRFTLDSGVTLMYDYFYNQWGSFNNIPGISATLYNDLHTYLNSFGQILQETPGQYLDNSAPVLMSFTTGWMSLANFQGYERFYFMFINGNYLSPFKLNCQFAFDFDPSIQQSVMITPTNKSSVWGGQALWGTGDVWGGPTANFDARVFPNKQKCQSFQITMNEIYDASFGVGAGAGLTLSGMNLVVGVKKGYRNSLASRNFG